MGSIYQISSKFLFSLKGSKKHPEVFLFFFPAQQPVGFLLWPTAVCVAQGGASPRAYAVLGKWSEANCQVGQKNPDYF